MTKVESERLAFWNMFNEMLAANGKPFNIRKATTDHWYDVAIGKSGAHVVINLVNKESSVVVELYISNDKDLFDRLHQEKDEIEEALGMKLDWKRMDHKKASRILYKIPGLNFNDHSNYTTLMTEIIGIVLKMRKVFSARI